MKIKSSIFQNYKLLFYFSLWILLWLSIGINPQEIELFFNNLDKQGIILKGLIKFLRIFIPLVLSIYFLLSLIFKIKVFKNFFYSNISNILLNLLILLQLIALLFSDNSNINIYWIYQCFVSLILIYLITKEDFSYSKIIINVSITILSIVLITFTFPFFSKFFFSHLSFYNMWPAVYSNDFSAPRPTGLSRTCLIVMIFFLVYEFNNKKLSIIKNTIIVLCSLIILLFQSRTILFLWPTLIILYLLLSKINFKQKVKKLIIYIILPILLFLSLNSLRYLVAHTNIFKLNPIEMIFSKSDEFIIENNELSKPTQIFRDTDPKSFSSFRTLHWKNIFKDSKKNFIGHGPMGDRHIINMSASSLFFYTLASSGYIGLILVIALSFRSAYLVFYFLFVKKIIYYNQDIYLIFSCFILIVLFLRGLLETSLGIFSIDYLMFITSSLICEISYSKKNKI